MVHTHHYMPLNTHWTIIITIVFFCLFVFLEKCTFSLSFYIQKMHNRLSGFTSQALLCSWNTFHQCFFVYHRHFDFQLRGALAFTPYRCIIHNVSMDRGRKVREFAEKIASNCSSFERYLWFIQRLIVNGSETFFRSKFCNMFRR